MKKLLLLGLILIVCSINAFAQERIITGRIFDENNIPLNNAQIRQSKSHKFYYSYPDINGFFHLVVDEKLEMNMVVKSGGFVTKTIAIDSAKSYYSIELVRDTTLILSEINGVERNERETAQSYNQKQKPSGKNSIDYNLMCDIMFNDFKSFEPLLGVENVDLLNKSNDIIINEFALKYHRFSYGLGFGYTSFTDSSEFLDLNLYNYQYALHFGYDILDSRHFTITPLVRLKWHIFNLLNSDLGDNIPLEQYLTYKELDLKFNQLTGFVGCNLAYKTGVAYTSLGNIGIGIYGGYLFKLNDKPWIYSEGNYLTTDKKIDIKNFNFGLYFMLYN
jgi:hypothetical protein